MSENNHSFGSRLTQAIQQKQTPLVVGLDPRFERLPIVNDTLLRSANTSDKAQMYTGFCVELINVIADLVPAVKPQAAFFEQLGPAGVIALGNVVNYARGKGLLVIMDAKRGDIGSTATAYADAYLNRSESGSWRCDALTVNPYLGDDSLTPFVDYATEHGSGIFVLVKTSNPGSQTFQELVANDTPLYQHVAQHVQSLAAESKDESGYGCVGAVIGATHRQQLMELRSQMPNTFFLVPGLGAQGGTAKDVAGAFDDNGLGAVVNSSRAIIFAHEQPEYAEFSDWQQAVERATRDTIDMLASETPAGKLRTEENQSQTTQPDSAPRCESH